LCYFLSLFFDFLKRNVLEVYLNGFPSLCDLLF
jgi:hypothetical protein